MPKVFLDRAPSLAKAEVEYQALQWHLGSERSYIYVRDLTTGKVFLATIDTKLFQSLLDAKLTKHFDMYTNFIFAGVNLKIKASDLTFYKDFESWRAF